MTFFNAPLHNVVFYIFILFRSRLHNHFTLLHQEIFSNIKAPWSCTSPFTRSNNWSLIFFLYFLSYFIFFCSVQYLFYIFSCRSPPCRLVYWTNYHIFTSRFAPLYLSRVRFAFDSKEVSLVLHFKNVLFRF